MSSYRVSPTISSSYKFLHSTSVSAVYHPLPPPCSPLPTSVFSLSSVPKDPPPPSPPPPPPRPYRVMALYTRGCLARPQLFVHPPFLSFQCRTRSVSPLTPWASHSDAHSDCMQAALVTGAARGLGNEFCRAFVESYVSFSAFSLRSRTFPLIYTR